MPHELIAEFVRGIGYDRADVVRRRAVLEQKVDAGLVLVRRVVVDEIGGPDLATGGPEHTCDRAWPTSRFPHCAGRQRLDVEQCAHRLGRRLVSVILSVDEGMATGISGVS
jgi:hypothetical protein